MFDLHRALNPKTVVVIGSKKADGYMWLRNYAPFAEDKASGRALYSVQIDPNEIPGIEAMGVTNYTSLLDVRKTPQVDINDPGGVVRSQVVTYGAAGSAPLDTVVACTSP